MTPEEDRHDREDRLYHEAEDAKAEADVCDVCGMPPDFCTADHWGNAPRPESQPADPIAQMNLRIERLADRVKVVEDAVKVGLGHVQHFATLHEERTEALADRVKALEKGRT